MSALYDTGRQGFLDGSIDWDTDDIRAILIDVADYTVDLAVHNMLDDVPAGARVAVSAALTGKTTSKGVADADNVTFSSVTGDPCEAVVVYKHTGTDSTSRLICYIDSASSGLPVTPNSGDITLVWDSDIGTGDPGIFML